MEETHLLAYGTETVNLPSWPLQALSKRAHHHAPVFVAAPFAALAHLQSFHSCCNPAKAQARWEYGL